MPTITTVGFYAAVTAVITGVGVIPLIFWKAVPSRLMSLASALASGLLLGAAFELIGKGTAENAGATIIGLILGLVFIAISRKWLEKRAVPEVGELAQADMLKAVVMIGVLTLHSFPEGIAVGLSLGKGLSFGFLITLVIALHNIPEGLAVGLVLVPKGVTTWKAGLWSIFTSLPQPLMAVPAFLLASIFKPALPFGLGLAAGAMIWMIGAEVLPDACGKASPRSIGAALTVGVVMMLSIRLLVI